MQLNLPSPLEAFTWPDELQRVGEIQKKQNIQILCKRDDLIHPIVSGNKWRKLKASIEFIKRNKIMHVLSFGGAYSNHLHSLAYVCKQESVKLSVCVRGDYSQQLTPMLQDIMSWGTEILYLSKLEYKKRHDIAFCNDLMHRTKARYIVPEGGSSKHVFDGLAELYNECVDQDETFTHLLTPVASGGTLAGLIHAMQTNLSDRPRCLLGIAMLKGEGYLEALVNDLLKTQPEFNQSNYSGQWRILHKYHHGGYAKTSDELLKFVNIFNQSAVIASAKNGLFLEPVYSGKTFFALKCLIEQRKLPTNSRVIVLHTGGLQGLRKN